jgi:hypothetical protein
MYRFRERPGPADGQRLALPKPFYARIVERMGRVEGPSGSEPAMIVTSYRLKPDARLRHFVCQCEACSRIRAQNKNPLDDAIFHTWDAPELDMGATSVREKEFS